jgi:hypothetical protein
MEDGLVFFLGMCFGSLLMLYTILRAIAAMQKEAERIQWKR